MSLKKRTEKQSINARWKSEHDRLTMKLKTIQRKAKGFVCLIYVAALFAFMLWAFFAHDSVETFIVFGDLLAWKEEVPTASESWHSQKLVIDHKTWKLDSRRRKFEIISLSLIFHTQNIASPVEMFVNFCRCEANRWQNPLRSNERRRRNEEELQSYSTPASANDERCKQHSANFHR